VHFNKGDILTLANTSNVQVFLSAPSLGTNAQTNSAYLKIVLLKEDSSSSNPQVNAANASFTNASNAANLSFVAGTTVNISQLPSDALLAQSQANNVVASLNAANASLLAASSFSTPASYAVSSANMANAMSMANAALVAANNAVATLNPANTAALVSANSNSSSAINLLASQPLVAL
jgi:hypothetical protein